LYRRRHGFSRCLRALLGARTYWLISNSTTRTPPTDERTNTHNILPHPNISTCQDVGMWQNVRPLVANCCTTSCTTCCVCSSVRPWVMCASVRVVEFDTKAVRYIRTRNRAHRCRLKPCLCGGTTVLVVPWVPGHAYQVHGGSPATDDLNLSK